MYYCLIDILFILNLFTQYTNMTECGPRCLGVLCFGHTTVGSCIFRFDITEGQLGCRLVT